MSQRTMLPPEAATAPITAENMCAGMPSQFAHRPHSRVSSSSVSPTSNTTARTTCATSSANGVPQCFPVHSVPGEGRASSCVDRAGPGFRTCGRRADRSDRITARSANEHDAEQSGLREEADSGPWTG